MSATKSTGDYWKRLSHDPHFAREMSERQQSLGGIYAKRETDSAESDITVEAAKATQSLPQKRAGHSIAKLHDVADVSAGR